MTEPSELILAEVRQANVTLDKLCVKLYGEDGFDGDIPEIKQAQKEQNGRVRKNTTKLTALIGILVGSGIIGGLEIADVIHLVGG